MGVISKNESYSKHIHEGAAQIKNKQTSQACLAQASPLNWAQKDPARKYS